MRVIDLTHTIKENMPVYPGTGTPKLEPANTYEENGFRETLVSFLFAHRHAHGPAGPPVRGKNDARCVSGQPVSWPRARDRLHALT